VGRLCPTFWTRGASCRICTAHILPLFCMKLIFCLGKSTHKKNYCHHSCSFQIKYASDRKSAGALQQTYCGSLQRSPVSLIGSGVGAQGTTDKGWGMKRKQRGKGKGGKAVIRKGSRPTFLTGASSCFLLLRVLSTWHCIALGYHSIFTSYFYAILSPPLPLCHEVSCKP